MFIQCEFSHFGLLQNSKLMKKKGVVSFFTLYEKVWDPLVRMRDDYRGVVARE